jgi:hypothetical protein
MKQLRQFLFTWVASLAFCLATHGAPVVGRPAPDFTATDINGQTHTLSAYRGRIVVLEWVNPECPFVRKHYDGSGNMPATQKLALAEGAVWLSINSGHKGAQGDFSASEVSAWLRKNGASPTAYIRDHEGRVGRLYDARHTPTLYVVSPDGTLVYAGGIDDINSANPADIARATNYVQAALADLKAGRPVAKAVTRAYGCGVKYAD